MVRRFVYISFIFLHKAKICDLFVHYAGEDSAGEVTEWLKVLAWKVSVPERVPGVRIPSSPLE